MGGRLLLVGDTAVVANGWGEGNVASSANDVERVVDNVGHGTTVGGIELHLHRDLEVDCHLEVDNLSVGADIGGCRSR